MRSRMRLCTALALLVAASLASPGRADSITILNVVTSNGYQFTNFDGPDGGTHRRDGHQHERDLQHRHRRRVLHRHAGADFTNFTANPLTSTVANVAQYHWIDGCHGLRDQLRRRRRRHQRQRQRLLLSPTAAS